MARFVLQDKAGINCMTRFVLQDKSGIKFYDSTTIAGVYHNQNNADQSDNVFRDPYYIHKEKTINKLVLDCQISEKEINLEMDSEY